MARGASAGGSFARPAAWLSKSRPRAPACRAPGRGLPGLASLGPGEAPPARPALIAEGRARVGGWRPQGTAPPGAGARRSRSRPVEPDRLLPHRPAARPEGPPAEGSQRRRRVVLPPAGLRIGGPSEPLYRRFPEAALGRAAPARGGADRCRRGRVAGAGARRCPPGVPRRRGSPGRCGGQRGLRRRRPERARARGRGPPLHRRITADLLPDDVDLVGEARPVVAQRREALGGLRDLTCEEIRHRKTARRHQHHEEARTPAFLKGFLRIEGLPRVRQGGRGDRGRLARGVGREGFTSPRESLAQAKRLESRGGRRSRGSADTPVRGAALRSRGPRRGGQATTASRGATRLGIRWGLGVSVPAAVVPGAEQPAPTGGQGSATSPCGGVAGASRPGRPAAGGGPPSRTGGRA